MSVEVNDILEGQYYIDEKCKSLQALLTTEPRFEGYIVKRQHWYEEYSSDSFIIQDTCGKDILTLEPWEIDALTDSKFLSYVDVLVNREPQKVFEYWYANLVIAFLVFPVVLVISVLDTVFPNRGISTTALVSTLLLMFLYAIVSYKEWRDTRSYNLRLDLAAAREDPMFVEALRELAAVPKSEYMYKNEHVKRLKKLETALAGSEA